MITREPSSPLKEESSPGSDRPNGRGLTHEEIQPSRALVVRVVVVLAILCIIGLLPRIRRQAELARAAAEASAQIPAVVVTHPVAAPDSAFILPGSTDAIITATINPRSSGYVIKRLVDFGDRVKKGQLLAVIASPDVDQQVRQAHADFLHAVAGANQAASDLTRQVETTAQAQAQLDAAVAQLKQAQANLATAVARLTQSEHNLSGAKASLVKAQKQSELSTRTWQRYDQLFHQGFVTQQDADTYKTAWLTDLAAVDVARDAVRSAEADVEASRTAVTAAQAGVDSAQGNVGAAQKNVAANKAGILSSQQNLKAAQANQDSFQANLQHNVVLQGFERVVAPCNGIITARTFDVGALVKADNVPTGNTTTAAQGMYGIAATDILRTYVQVPQTYMRYMKQGDKALLAASEFPDRIFEGTIYRVSGGLDPTSRTIQIEIHINNQDGTLLPGMYVEARLASDKLRRRLRIPATALIFNAQGTKVATVVGGNKIHLIDIDIARDLGTELEIETGLKPSDSVVVNPSDDLSEGTTVDVTESPVVASPTPALKEREMETSKVFSSAADIAAAVAQLSFSDLLKTRATSPSDNDAPGILRQLSPSLKMDVPGEDR